MRRVFHVASIAALLLIALFAASGDSSFRDSAEREGSAVSGVLTGAGRASLAAEGSVAVPVGQDDPPPGVAVVGEPPIPLPLAGPAGPSEAVYEERIRTSGSTTDVVIGVAAGSGGGGDGELDPTFGDGGIVLEDFGGLEVFDRAMAIQPDGKIIMAGRDMTLEYEDRFALARFQADGSLDPSFGQGGLALVSAGFYPEDIALLPDGKILGGGRGGALMLARFQADGSLDPSFGTGGIAANDVPNDIEVFEVFGEAMAVQPDGKIILAGSVDLSPLSNGWPYMVARHHPDGSLDTSFGTNGIVLTEIGPYLDWSEAVALQPDGKIVLAGHTYHEFVIIRYNPDGSLDSSFGIDGVTKISFRTEDIPYDVVVQPDGKIVVAGYSSVGNMDDEFALARLNPDGSLDTSFGQGGKVESDFEGNETTISAITLQADGKIVAAGRTETQEGDLFVIARYLADGSLDTSFGSGGVQYTPFAADWASPSGIAMQSDDKIVVGGGAAVNLGCIPQDDGPPLCEYEDYFALARYTVSLDCYALTVSPPNGGSVTADPPPNCGSSLYQPGTVVQLTSTPEGGYGFGGWSGDASGSDNPVEVTMEADREVDAHFTLLPIEGEMPVGEVEIEVSGGGPYTVTLHVKGFLPDACTKVDRVEQSREGANVTVDVLTLRRGGTICAQTIKPYSLDVLLDGDFAAGDYSLTLNGEVYDFSVP